MVASWACSTAFDPDPPSLLCIDVGAQTWDEFSGLSSLGRNPPPSNAIISLLLPLLSRFAGDGDDVSWLPAPVEEFVDGS